MRIVTIVGARPQFIKAAVLSRLIDEHASLDEFLVHTGQHYDDNMSDVFFRELAIRKPNVSLHCGSGSHGEQTGKMLAGIEKVLLEQRPDAVVVYGDTNSTIAGSLAAAKLQIPVAHVEAGLRSFDRSMPEEINRCVTDHLSTWHFCPTGQAADNLNKEGIADNIHLVGDVMYDALLYYREQSSASETLQRLGLHNQPYALCTLHRAGNTDEANRFTEIWHALGRLSELLPVVLPVHPRTRNVLARSGINTPDSLHLVDPVGYPEMVALEKHAALIATDSGGVQKEAYFHGVPCLTMRDNTEWTETVASGWNCLVGANGESLLRHARQFLEGELPKERPDYYGDGQAGRKILEVLAASDDGLKRSSAA